MEINKMLKFKEESISVFGTNDQPRFIGTQIANLLGYALGRKAVVDHVWDESKITVADYKKLHPNFQSNLKSNITLINEDGLYSLVFQSKLPLAIEFKKWVFSMLSEMRKHGMAMIPKHNQLVIMNENDLHKKVINFIRNNYKNALINATLGELQDTSFKRVQSKILGYTSGVCDLIIFNPNHQYNGMCIEFKSPLGTGILTDKQSAFQKQIKLLNWRCITSDNYDDILMEIIQYFNTVRISCEHCMCKFGNHKTYTNHLKHFHRIKL